MLTAVFDHNFLLLMTLLALATPLLQVLVFLAACMRPFDAVAALFRATGAFWPTGRAVVAVLLCVYTYRMAAANGAGFFSGRDLFGLSSVWLHSATTWGLGILWAPALLLLGVRPQLWLGYTVIAALALGSLAAMEAMGQGGGLDLLRTVLAAGQVGLGHAGYSLIALVPLLLLSSFVWLVLNADEEPDLKSRF